MKAGTFYCRVGVYIYTAGKAGTKIGYFRIIGFVFGNSEIVVERYTRADSFDKTDRQFCK